MERGPLIQRGYVGGRRLSSDLWWDCPIRELMHGFKDGTFHFNDFHDFGGTVTSNVGTYSRGLKSYEDTGDVLSVIATETTGVLKLAIAATNNNESWITTGNNTGVLGKVTSLSGKRVWCEQRVKLGSILTQNLFIGAGEEGLAAAETITDAGALASKDLIGFQVLEDDPGYFDTVYRKAGQTAQVVKNQAQAITADTYYKLGWKYTGPNKDLERGGERLEYWVNGVKLADYVTAAQIAAATFPTGEELALLFGGKNANAANNHYLDWWALAYEE